jgi:hypothetical protein
VGCDEVDLLREHDCQVRLSCQCSWGSSGVLGAYVGSHWHIKIYEASRRSYPRRWIPTFYRCEHHTGWCGGGGGVGGVPIRCLQMATSPYNPSLFAGESSGHTICVSERIWCAHISCDASRGDCHSQVLRLVVVFVKSKGLKPGKEQNWLERSTLGKRSGIGTPLFRYLSPNTSLSTLICAMVLYNREIVPNFTTSLLMGTGVDPRTQFDNRPKCFYFLCLSSDDPNLRDEVLCWIPQSRFLVVHGSC